MNQSSVLFLFVANETGHHTRSALHCRIAPAGISTAHVSRPVLLLEE